MNIDNEKNEALKLGNDDIICHNCNFVLTIPDELKNEEFLVCSNCNSAIDNPFFHSGKFVICAHCGTDSELPKTIENDLTITCGLCKQTNYNPHSDYYNSISCPHCFFTMHLPDNLIQEKNLMCSNCDNVFKNTYYKRSSASSRKPEVIERNLHNDETLVNKVSDESKGISKKQRIWIIVGLVIVVLYIRGFISENSSSSHPIYTVNQSTYVATGKSNFDEMFRYINNGDMEALSTLISVGEVRRLSNGVKVNLVEAKFHYCIVRLSGSRERLWIVTEHITKD